MARPSKRKIKVKKQERNNNGTFTKKSRIVDNRKEEDYWGDEENSGWDEIDLPNEDENKKRGPYLTGTTKKSNFDKYRPSGSFTKAAKGTSNILTLINKQSNPDDFDEVVNDVENEHNDQLNLKERIETIFEYLKRLDDNEGNKTKASIEAAQLVFIDNAPYRARTIHDENIAKEYHTWIRSQGGKITPLKFKTFIEQKLLVDSGIMKKNISTKIATRWLKVLGYFFSHKNKAYTTMVMNMLMS
ncbi:8063_t:CDS:2 [Funneliformis geosporum]|nr:8063_t:CDS:2 [Funneliformis geosporum]